MILESQQYRDGGALFIIGDEAEGSGQFSDGPIGMFELSPFAKSRGTSGYSTSISHGHSTKLKTMQQIFHATTLQSVQGRLDAPATSRVVSRPIRTRKCGLSYSTKIKER